MEHILVPDTSAIAVNCGKKDNESSNIIYRDNNGVQHTIDFEICAENYKSEHNNASVNCIGERKMDESYFIFYTSGMKTKVIFEKMYVGNILRHHFFSGNKRFRFLDLWNRINITRYTTFDLS